MDLSPVAHLAAIKGRVPFLNFFDGFRTSHEIQKVAMWDFDDLKDMLDMDAVQAFRDHALNPEHPHARGSHENGDVFFQHREACNKAYDELPAVVEEYMGKINAKLGTDYGLFNYYGAPDADRVVVCMGSFCDVLEEVIDYLNAHGEKVGLVKVRLFRPFSIKHFVDVLPETVKKIAVMDRTKEPGSIGEPLYQDVVSALYEAGKTDIHVSGGRYGLGSKDTPPASAFAVFEELKKDEPKREFTIGINDDVTHLSLPEDEDAPNTADPSTIECKFWGLGGDGTVGANKNSIKIIGDHTDKYVQAYFQYDSKKTGGVTVSHLRFGDSPIRSPYYVTKADFVACHNPSYIIKGFKMVRDVKPGGTFLVNCQWSDEEFAEHMPAVAKRYIAKNNVNVYLIDAIDLAAKVGMGKRTNTVLQSAFFALAPPPSTSSRFLLTGPLPRTLPPRSPSRAARRSSSRSRRSWTRSTAWTATRCPFPPSRSTSTASGSSVPLSTRSAALPLWFRTGMRPSASSATSAPTSARTPRFARSPSRLTRLPRLLRTCA